jgi:hypothetical protein
MGLTFNNGRNAAAMTSNSSLNVGVNCTPNAQFEVLGSTGGALTDGIRVSRNTLQSSQYGVINYTSGILNLTGVNTSGGGEIRFNTSDGTTTNERMRITSAGNVGIGTTSPNQKFNVVNSIDGFSAGISGTTYGLRFDNGGSFAFGGSTIHGVDNTLTSSYQTLGLNGSQIIFGTSYTERMRLTSVGLAIGTSTPYAALQVNGNVHRQFTGTGTSGSPISEEGFVYSEQSNSTALAGMWFTNNFQSASGVNVVFKSRSDGGTVAERMRISNNSYGSLIAIGTSTPTNGGSAASWITIDGTTAGSYSGGLAFSYNSAAKVYQFWDNNNFYIQNGALGVYLARDASSWSSVSDERLKDITGSIDNAVEKLMTLRAVNFSWKSDETNKENLGLIAQDVEKVFPQVVDKNKLSIGVNNNTDDNEYLGVRYQDLVPVLVKAIQEQQQQIEELRQIVATK